MIARHLILFRSEQIRAIARRLGWGVSDQAISSLSNFVMGVIVVRTLGDTSFGAFTVAFLTYSLILNASRGLSTDPLLVRYSGTDHPTWRRVVACGSGTALVVGSAAGVLSIAVGILLPSPLNGAFIALGIGLPGLMLQDSWRFSFFAAGRGSQAFLNDTFWTVLLIGGLLALVATGHVTVFNSLLVFGLTATVAALLGLAQTRVRPDMRAVRRWLVDHRSLGVRYLMENTASSGATQLRALIIGALAGLATVGQIQAGMMLLGPFLVVLMGLAQVAVPEASHVLTRGGPRRLRRFTLLLGGALAVGAVLWGAAMVLVLPHGLGELLLGSTWSQTSPLVPPLTIQVIWACFSVGFGAGLRALGASRLSLRAQLLTSTMYLSGGVIGGLIGTALAVCWVAAGAAFVSAMGWGFALRRGVRLHASELSAPPTGALSAGAAR